MQRAFLRSTLLATVLLLASCGSEPSPTGLPPISGPTAAADLSAPLAQPLLTGLLYCSPMPYASASKIVGPAGGTLQAGPHVLRIPAGALSQRVRITMVAPSDTVVSVKLSPEGLQFNAGKPARLTLDYHNCPLGELQVGKRIAYTTNALQILVYLLSTDDLLLKQVSAPLEHFSRYAIAW